MLNGVSLEARVTGLIGRILVERSIKRSVIVDDDLREVGLTSLDMVSLVLSVEAEFDVQIPETEMRPANFRSIRTISIMVAALLN